MTIAEAILPHIATIPPYPPGKPIEDVAREFGLDPAKIVKLASNENPLGCAPSARKAIVECAAETFRYPDFHNFLLKAAIAKFCAVDEDHILPACGSSEIILLAAHAYLNAARVSAYPKYSFASYEGASMAAGSRGVATAVGDDWIPDLDALLAAGKDAKTSIVFLATPNNPTGALTSTSDVLAFAKALPENVLLVIDEAYRDYLAEEDRPDVAALLRSRQNILLLRTFSKIFGLAGARVGYAIGHPEMIRLLQPMAAPFGVNLPGQNAAAAALKDSEFITHSRTHNENERRRLCELLGEAGIEYVPSHGNFVLAKVGDGVNAFRKLMAKGVIVRPVSNYGLPEWIRVSVGLEQENDAFIKALRAIK
jgi:histidinol-phosphate aminotransferase